MNDPVAALATALCAKVARPCDRHASEAADLAERLTEAGWSIVPTSTLEVSHWPEASTYPDDQPALSRSCGWDRDTSKLDWPSHITAGAKMTDMYTHAEMDAEDQAERPEFPYSSRPYSHD